MNVATQAEIFQVLLDRAEQDGGLAVEIRQWIADHLVALQLLGPWEASIEESSGNETRRQLGANRGAPWVCHMQHHTRGTDINTGRPANYWLASGPGMAAVRREYSSDARALADTAARERGWVIADRPLEQLCRRLRELGEFDGFVDDLESRSTPSKEYQHIYDVHGHDAKVRDCLRQLGFKPGEKPAAQPAPDMSWLRLVLVREDFDTPTYIYTGMSPSDDAGKAVERWVAERDPAAMFRVVQGIEYTVDTRLALLTTPRTINHGDRVYSIVQALSGEDVVLHPVLPVDASQPHCLLRLERVVVGGNTVRVSRPCHHGVIAVGGVVERHELQAVLQEMFR